MNHADVRDRMEVAALEPDGLDRLMAGDAPDSAGIAGHLAGCPSCLDELGRLGRTATLVRRALDDGATPDVYGPLAQGVPNGAPFDEAALPPDLRERTLAFVREFGVRRPVLTLAEAAATVEPARVAAAAPAAAEAPAPAAAPGRSAAAGLPAEAGAPARTALGGNRRFLRPAAWAASLAAAIVVSVVATSLLLGANRTNEDTADLARLAAFSVDVARAPDSRQVSLWSTRGAATVGLLAFVPSNGELVVTAHDLAPAPAGSEYRCWMAVAGGRRVVGKMFFAGGIAYWVGPVTGLGAVASGTKFGVTLVDLSGPSIDGDPVLLGTL